jgi:hypothetical protein
MRFVDVGGSLEAARDERLTDSSPCLVLRQKGTSGPNFHLTRQVVLELLGLFHSGRGVRDEFVVFDVYADGWNCGSAALCLVWSEADVLTELRSKGYPLDRNDCHVAVFRGWPSDREFTLTWGKIVYRFASQGSGQDPGRSP